MTKFLLLGGELSSGNRGVDAITLGSIHCLQRFFPDAQFSIVGFTSPTSTLTTRHIQISDSQIDVDEATTAFRRGAQMALRTLVTRSPSTDVALKFFWWADAVVDISAGDGFGDTYGTKVLLRHSLGKLLALRLGKPLIIFPQTMGPFRTQLSRVLAGHLLRRADLVCVREHFSEELVQRVLGRPRKVVCLADMAFLMQEADTSVVPHLLSELPKTDKLIGVNVSGLLWHRGQEMYRENKVAFDYRETMIGIIRRLVQETDRTILLVPHVFSESQAGDSGACREIHELLRDLGGRVILLKEEYSAPEIKAIIARCEFFVGARMHACIAALSTGTPVVPISYSHKFAGILQYFGTQEWLVNPMIVSQEQAVDLVLSGYEHRKEIKRQIIAKLPLVESKAMRAGQLLKDTIA